MPALIYLQDLHETGVLHTADNGAEYKSRIEDIDRLAPLQRREALRVPLVHLASAPVNHHAARNDWAAHLPRDHKSEAALEAAFCVQVCILMPHSCASALPQDVVAAVAWPMGLMRAAACLYRVT